MSHHRHTYQEYLAYERDSALKHEFDDGDIIAMAGGSRRHNALASLDGAGEWPPARRTKPPRAKKARGGFVVGGGRARA